MDLKFGMSLLLEMYVRSMSPRRMRWFSRGGRDEDSKESSSFIRKGWRVDMVGLSSIKRFYMW